MMCSGKLDSGVKVVPIRFDVFLLNQNGKNSNSLFRPQRRRPVSQESGRGKETSMTATARVRSPICSDVSQRFSRLDFRFRNPHLPLVCSC